MPFLRMDPIGLPGAGGSRPFEILLPLRGLQPQFVQLLPLEGVGTRLDGRSPEVGEIPETSSDQNESSGARGWRRVAGGSANEISKEVPQDPQAGRGGMSPTSAEGAGETGTEEETEMLESLGAAPGF